VRRNSWFAGQDWLTAKYLLRVQCPRNQTGPGRS
jgi:hypothetical protein